MPPEKVVQLEMPIHLDKPTNCCFLETYSAHADTSVAPKLQLVPLYNPLPAAFLPEVANF